MEYGRPLGIRHQGAEVPHLDLIIVGGDQFFPVGTKRNAPYLVRMP